MIYIRDNVKSVYSMPNFYRYTVCEREKESPDGVFFNIVELIYNTTAGVVHSARCIKDFDLESSHKHQPLSRWFVGGATHHIRTVTEAYRSATFQDIRVREVKHLQNTYLLFQVDAYEDRVYGSELLVEDRLDGLRSVEFFSGTLIKEIYNHSEPMYSFNRNFQERYIGFYKKHLLV